MLGSLKAVGLNGVTVLPGPMRYLQLDRRIDGTGSLAGMKIGVQDSPLEREALKALGADPVTMASGASIRELNGVEMHPEAIHGNHYVDTAEYTVADAPLWPRPFVVFADADAWADLSASERRVLEEAGEAARTQMLLDEVDREQQALAGMCKAGNRMVLVGAAGRARLAEAVRPLIERLRDDPATSATMAEIEGAREGGAPHTLSCPAGSSTQKAALTGRFTTTLRKSEPGSDSIAHDWIETEATSIRMDLVLEDGRAVITEHYTSGPATGFDETYTVFKDVIQFSGTGGGPVFTARWRLDGKRLRFSEVGGGPDDKFVWGRTWVRAD